MVITLLLGVLTISGAGVSLQCGCTYLMSIILMVNEKWRERVPLWDAFEQTPDQFPDFFHCLLETCLSDLEVRGQVECL